MKFRLFLPLILLAGFAGPARAELRLVASATSDSYQSLTYGFSAFCQAAGFPFALTEINDKASDLLFVPNLAGINVQARLWLFWLTDVQKDQPASNLVAVAILPTLDGAATTMQALASVYPDKTPEARSMILRYAVPSEEAPRVAVPVLYVAVRRGFVIASPSRGAVLWAIGRPLPTPPAEASTAAGQVRFDFQPAALAALAAEEHAELFDQIPLLETARSMLPEIRALALTLESTTEGVTFRLSVSPMGPSPLAGLLRRMHPPSEDFWKICPDRSALSIAYGGMEFWQIPALHGTNHASQARNAASVLGDCLTGDRTLFVDRLAATNDLFYAEVFGITDRTVAWNRALADPQALLPFEMSIPFVTNGMRTIRGTPVLNLTRRGFASPSADGAQHPADMAAFMLRAGGVSLAATTNRLVVTFGASNAMEQVLLRLADLPTDANTLTNRCRKLLPGLAATPDCVVLLQPTELLRQIAQALPGLQPEQLAALPRPGDGLAVSTVREADGTLCLTVRVSANEVARLQEGLTRGHGVLQEMFMQMALQQVLQQEQKSAPVVDPRNPTP